MKYEWKKWDNLKVINDNDCRGMLKLGGIIIACEDVSTDDIFSRTSVFLDGKQNIGWYVYRFEKSEDKIEDKIPQEILFNGHLYILKK
jgi:hypothetical protein